MNKNDYIYLFKLSIKVPFTLSLGFEKSASVDPINDIDIILWCDII